MASGRKPRKPAWTKSKARCQRSIRLRRRRRASLDTRSWAPQSDYCPVAAGPFRLRERLSENHAPLARLAGEPCRASRADTIYQMNAQGRQVVVQRDAIVVSEDSSFVVYKHFDLKDRRVEIVRLNKGSLPYSVETSQP